jgi:hypothetical protein
MAMTEYAQEFYELARLALLAGVTDTDTFAEAKEKIAAFRELKGYEKRQIKITLGSDRQELLERRNRRNCVLVNPKPPESVYAVAKREEEAAEVRRRASLPVVDLTLPADEIERQQRRFDAEDARALRASFIPDDEVQSEDGETRGTPDAPIDLTTKNTERFSFGRARVKAASRASVKTRAKGSRASVKTRAKGSRASATSRRAR